MSDHDDMSASAVALLTNAPPDGSSYEGKVKVERCEYNVDADNIYWYSWSQGSTFGLGGQIDQMSESEMLSFMEEAAKYSWRQRGKFSEQVQALCEFYKAPELYQTLSQSGWDQAEGKWVGLFKGLEQLLRQTWAERRPGEACPEPRGFLHAPGSYGEVRVTLD